MKNVRLFFVLSLTITLNYATAQLCTGDDRFTNVDYFLNSDIDALTNVTYGNAINWQGNNEVLKLDFYFPNNVVDTLARRPFILLVHGGGFTAGDKMNYRNMCRAFAKRGFVTATMGYRLGFDQTDPIGIQKAIYRAQQDANAALRFSVDMADSLRIDTSWIFMGGISAGSITALFTQYSDQGSWNSSIPGIASTLGPLNSSGNNLTHTFDVKALYNNCGSCLDGSLISNALKPMVSFHGLLDNIVPIDSAANLIGSRVIHNTLNTNGICNDFTIDPSGFHCPHPESLMVNRTACFFKSLFCNACTDFFSTNNITPSCSGSTVSIVESSDLNKMAIFPNPFQYKLNITGISGNEYFYLYDYFGRVIYEGSEIQNENFKLLASGAYMLLISDGNKYQTFKVFKN